MKLFGLILTLSTMMYTAHVQAGWFKDFCERHLIMEDPFPFSEVSTRHLFELHRLKPDQEILKELIFRLRTGMMTDNEQKFFWETFYGEGE